MISIIIPVYNAERFLGNCLDSILSQTYTDWELICVNDGSIDNSLQILQSYADKDKRIYVISKQNEGVSVARNIALDLAKGEFIYFADADDLVEPMALESLVTATYRNDTDFVKADFKPINAIGDQLFLNKRMQIRKRYNARSLNSEKFYQNVLMGEFFLWTCLFKIDIIKKNNIRFISGCRFMEDAAFIVEYLSHCNLSVYLCKLVYQYRIYGMTAGQSDKDYTQDLNLIEQRFISLQDSSLTCMFLNKIIKIRKKRGKWRCKWGLTLDNILLNFKYLLCKIM